LSPTACGCSIRSIPNKAFKVRPEDGTIIEDAADRIDARQRDHLRQRRALDHVDEKDRSEGAADDLKVDAKDGKTLKSWPTPGSGLYGRSPTTRPAATA
jgi:hypothetical protein